MTFHSIVTVALGCFQINVDVVTGSSVTGFYVPCTFHCCNSQANSQAIIKHTFLSSLNTNKSESLYSIGYCIPFGNLEETEKKIHQFI